MAGQKPATDGANPDAAQQSAVDQPVASQPQAEATNVAQNPQA